MDGWMERELVGPDHLFKEKLMRLNQMSNIKPLVFINWLLFLVRCDCSMLRAIAALLLMIS